jgi:hypothetical protein
MFKPKQPKAKMPKGTTAGGSPEDINPAPYLNLKESDIKKRKTNKRG